MQAESACENDVAVIVALTVVTIIAIAIALEREYTTDGELSRMASPKPPEQFRQLFEAECIIVHASSGTVLAQYPVPLQARRLYA